MEDALYMALCEQRYCPSSGAIAVRTSYGEEIHAHSHWHTLRCTSSLLAAAGIAHDLLYEHPPAASLDSLISDAQSRAGIRPPDAPEKIYKER